MRLRMNIDSLWTRKLAFAAASLRVQPEEGIPVFKKDFLESFKQV